ncbi:MAG: MarR family transcriptional regulator [Solobacterium sp.]|jgi:DNA-binding MarR family transcriptional regulator|nr:MarR family transcriptional regulator [Solobacterium sp.]MCH4222268.1 MarR family transcriptional regulator [Solobacterium sp.]MCH4265371.1 MarR family transcriptional regulator [Solobacterium sp.]
MNTSEIRVFNRYYDRLLGVFSERALDTAYTMPQARVIGEIYRNPGISANQIAGYLEMDRSYLSRMLRKMETEGTIERRPSTESQKIKCLYLTKAGNVQADLLEQRSDERIQHQLNALSKQDIQLLIRDMQEIKEILTNVFSESYPDKQEKKDD